MFQFSRCPPYTYFIQYTVHGHYSMWVPPFGYLRIIICLRLPAAFRSLPRPSSATGAKASSLRSFMLDLLRSFLSAFASWSEPVSHVSASRSPLAVFSSLSFFELSGIFVFHLAEIVCFRLLFLPCSFPTLLLPSHSFLVIQFSRYIVFHLAPQGFRFRFLPVGGLKWTRTTDLALIRRAL